MAIVIKEIQVKTVVERTSVNENEWDKAAVNEIKEQLYRRLKKDMEKELRRRKER